MCVISFVFPITDIAVPAIAHGQFRKYLVIATELLDELDIVTGDPPI